jgi:hypothetical protein
MGQKTVSSFELWFTKSVHRVNIEHEKRATHIAFTKRDFYAPTHAEGGEIVKLET